VVLLTGVPSGMKGNSSGIQNGSMLRPPGHTLPRAVRRGFA
jgi:hypothetical protein